MKYDCIVIGAGVAGLIAANELGKAGKQVLLLEARSRAGGRICTLNPPGFSRYVESGAEFIHGDLPLTSSILHRANIPLAAMDGEMYQRENGSLQKHDFFSSELELVTTALKKLKIDMPFSEFLKREFPQEKYKSLNRHITQFVEGYNAADSSKVSSVSLREEWLQDEDPVQYRPVGGYGKLIDFLVKENTSLGILTQFSKVVTTIRWQEGEAEIETSEAESFLGSKVLITVPIGVLQANTLTITPAIPEQFRAVDKIGFGPVIKFILQFREDFWQRALSGKLPSAKFIFSDAPIPTWWSQLPDQTPILTGWLGGPSAAGINFTRQYLFQLAQDSLSYILKCPRDTIQTQIVALHIENWKADPFALGAYSYATMETPYARKILAMPILNTLYFAGEALYDGPHTGTVEAALTNGKEVAQKINSAL